MKRHLLPAVIISALAFAYLAPTLVSDRVLLPADLLLVMSPWKYHARQFSGFRMVQNPLLDVIQQYYPWRHFAATSYGDGELPLWNPYMYSGVPFVGNGQSAIFYPLNFLFLLLPTARAFAWTAWLHLSLIGWAAYGLAWLVWRSRLAGLAAAAGLMFCGFHVVWLEYQTLLITATWIPVTLLCQELSLRGHGRGWSIAAGVSLAMATLAGHFQIAAYSYLGLWAHAALRAGGRARSGRGEEARRDMTWAVAATGIGVGLSACQWMNSVELASMSSRVGGIDVSRIHELAFSPREWVTLFVPNFFGNQADYNYWGRFNFIELCAYPGAVALLLAGLACRTQPRRRWLPWALLAGGAFWLAMAWPPYSWLARLPGFSQLAAPARIVALMSCALVVLAAGGVAALLRQDLPARRLAGVWLVWAVAGAVVVTVAVARNPEFLEDQLLPYSLHQLVLFGAFVALSGVVLATLRSRRLRAGALAALWAGEMMLFAIGFNPMVDQRMVYFSTPTIEFLRRQREPYRVLCVGNSMVNWTPNNCLMPYGIPVLQGSDSLRCGHYADFLSELQPGAPTWEFAAYRSPVTAMANVRFVIAPRDVSLPTNEEFVVAADDDMNVYENRSAWPRATLHAQWRALPAENDVLLELTARDFDPGSGLLFAQHDAPRTSRRTGALGEVRLTQWDGNRVIAEANVRQPCLMMLSDTWYPGWRCWVDGRLRRILRCDYVFRAVELDAGVHRVVMVYWPVSIRLGLYLSLVTMALLFAVLCARWGQWRRRGRP